MSKRATMGCFGGIIAMMLLCGVCQLASGSLLEAQVRALEPPPYPESTSLGTQQSYAFQNAHKEMHYYCTKDPEFVVRGYYEDTLREPCDCKTLPEWSKIFGLISTGRYFGGGVYLRTYPHNDRCDGGTLYSFEYVWAK